MRQIFILAVMSMLLFCGTGQAQVRLEGTFVAAKSCPALQSIKKKTNPGDVTVSAGQNYSLLGKNREQASHYWVMVPGAQPERRWVAVDCGSVNGEAAQTAPQSNQKPGKAAQAAGSNFYILALSWQPAFCESHADKKECKSATPDDYEAKNFALHGLWPQPRSAVFCNVSEAERALDDNHRWENLPEPNLMPETKILLDKVMPGTQSMLERHEYIKHGTCYPASADQYFKDSVRLVEAVNGSDVQKLVSANVGKMIKTVDLRAAFDATFGAGAGLRVRVACDRDGDRLLISEITIGLQGNIPGGASVSDLILASMPTDAGCPAGIIDPVQRQ